MCGAEGIGSPFQPGQEDFVDRVDRNARAYGWEVGRGAPLRHAGKTTPGNPFLDPNWRDHVENEPEQSLPPEKHRTDCTGRCLEDCSPYVHANAQCRHTRPDLWELEDDTPPESITEDGFEKITVTGAEGEWVDVAPGVRLRLGEEPEHGEPGEDYVSGDEVFQTVPAGSEDDPLERFGLDQPIYSLPADGLSGQIVVWEDPPEPTSRAAAVIVELEASPGHWAKIAHEEKGPKIFPWWNALVGHEHIEWKIVTKGSGLFPPRDIYARWTGPTGDDT